MNSRLPKIIFYGLLAAILVLLFLNVWSYLSLYYNDLDPQNYFFRKTNFNEEKNAPSIFSSILHFIAALLSAAVAFSKLKVKKNQKFWLFLSGILLFTGLDELLRIHEKIGKSISDSFDTSGIFLFSWVIPYTIAVVVLGLLIFKPLFDLPKKTYRNFIAAGFIFIMGAIGVEMFTGWYIGYSHLNLTGLLIIPEIFILSTIEELLEMIGMSFFIYSILLFLDQYKLTSQNKFNL